MTYTKNIFLTTLAVTSAFGMDSDTPKKLKFSSYITPADATSGTKKLPRGIYTYNDHRSIAYAFKDRLDDLIAVDDTALMTHRRIAFLLDEFIHESETDQPRLVQDNLDKYAQFAKSVIKDLDPFVDSFPRMVICLAFPTEGSSCLLLFKHSLESSALNGTHEYFFIRK
jgi:hypothetical protein